VVRQVEAVDCVRLALVSVSQEPPPKTARQWQEAHLV
jgi:hypothetical protein